MLLLAVDPNGNRRWERVVGARGGNDIPHNLQVRRDGRIQASGYTQSWGATVHDMLALTLSPDGHVLRHEIFGGPDDDRVMLAAVDAEGRTWLTGYTRSAGAGGWDVFLTRLDRDGGFEGFLTTFGGLEDDYGTAVLPLDDGSLLMAGHTENSGSGRQDAVLMRVTRPQWTGPAPGFRRPRIE